VTSPWMTIEDPIVAGFLDPGLVEALGLVAAGVAGVSSAALPASISF